MKLELIVEKKIGEEPFYMIYQDGKYLTGNRSLEKIENLYNEILDNPTKISTVKVLRSDEIVVPLNENKTE